jgi:chromate transporter
LRAAPNRISLAGMDSMTADVAPPPSRTELFLAYLRIGLLGFGGVAAWSRRVIVEERRWLTERDYAEVIGLCQVLPGPNVGNSAVILGRRFHGLPGVLCALAGMYAAPLAILVAMLLLYGRYGDAPSVAPLMVGVAAAAAGMVAGTALKMATKLRLPPEAIAVGALALVGAAFLRLPLPWLVVGLAPVGIAGAAWRWRRDGVSRR